MVRMKTINQDNLREHNLSIVMQTLLGHGSPLSRAQLAQKTGLTKAAMSLLTDMLIQAQVLQQMAPTSEPNSGFGRPATPLAFVPHRWAGIGLQINTDGYGYLILDISGTIVRSEWISKAMIDTDPATIFAELDRMVRPAEAFLKDEGYQLCGAGLALPGLVEGENKLLFARNLGWTDLDLSQFDVVRRLHAHAYNEANVAAIAQIPGFATVHDPDSDQLDPSDSFIFISTDVGIGGALVRDGHLEAGQHGFAGEIGHLQVDPHGVHCTCGRTGCLETLAGRRALVEAAGITTHEHSAERTFALDLISRWQQGDSQAAAAIYAGLNALTSVLASVVNVVDIDTIVLGGLWSELSGSLAPRLQAGIQDQIIGSASVKVRVLTSAVPEHSALVGAAQVGLRQFIDHPRQFLPQAERKAE